SGSEQEKTNFEKTDQLFCLVSQAQSGRMDEQRCSINPLSPGHMDNSQSDQDVEKFFKLIASTQSRRFDDQRATLNKLPEITSPHGMTAQDSDHLILNPYPSATTQTASPCSTGNSEYNFKISG
uniref:Uncharacterized protein n=1 Tax=Cyprinus carpio carpio TaxID=630221 RepID=A0A8C1BDI8_CYPCA